MKTKIPPLKKRAHLAHKDPADVAILIKGIQLCLHEVRPAMTSLFPEHPVIQSFENNTIQLETKQILRNTTYFLSKT